METKTEGYAIKEYHDMLAIWKGQPYEALGKDEWNQIKYNQLFSSFLQLSPCVSWILDLRSVRFSFISNNTNEILGYAPRMFEEKCLDLCNEIKHPEDLERTWKLIKKVWSHMMDILPEERAFYKFNYGYRIIKENGEVVRILEQNAVLQQDSKGNITHILGICNDITNWKKSGDPISSISSPLDNTTLFYTSDDSKKNVFRTVLSKRELEIVNLLAQGHSSKYIADKLCISFHTVNTHRQNMIGKTKTKNTAELLQFASSHYLI